MPKQFYVAREYQIVSLISDMLDLFKKCNSKEMVDHVKEIVFLNLMMGTIGEERKYIKSLGQIISNGYFNEYYKKQKEIGDKIEERRSTQELENLLDLKQFCRNNVDVVDDLNDSLDDVLLESRRTETHNKPAQIVTKTIKSLNEIDLNVVNNLNPLEKDVVINQVRKLSRMINKIDEAAGNEIQAEVPEKKQTVEDAIKISSLIAKPLKYNESIIYVAPTAITSLCFKATIKCSNLSETKFINFADDKFEAMCPEYEINNGENSILVELNSKVSSSKKCYLIVKSRDCDSHEANIVYKIDVDIAFNGDFGF